jgi:hypothetical protein
MLRHVTKHTRVVYKTRGNLIQRYGARKRLLIFKQQIETIDAKVLHICHRCNTFLMSASGN